MGRSQALRVAWDFSPTANLHLQMVSLEAKLYFKKSLDLTLRYRFLFCVIWKTEIKYKHIHRHHST